LDPYFLDRFAHLDQLCRAGLGMALDLAPLSPSIGVIMVIPVAHRKRQLVGTFGALTVPKEVEHWLLTTLREKLVKIGAKVVRHGRYITFQLAEVAVSRELFRKILSLIDDLRRRPAPA